MIKLSNILNEIEIKQSGIYIHPRSKLHGTIIIDKDIFEYNIRKNKVVIDVPSSEKVIDLSLKNNPDIEDDENYYPEEESRIVAEEILKIPVFKKNGKIVPDEYNCSDIAIPLDVFLKFPSKKVESLGNNTFSYKGNILILKELTPLELEKYRKEYQRLNHLGAPHMKYDKDLERSIQYSEVNRDNKVYWIMDKDGKIFKSMYNPGFNDRDAVFGIPKNDNLEDYKLDLIKYFDFYYK